MPKSTSNSKSYDQFDSKKVILEFSNTNDASSLDVIFLTNFGTIQGYTLRGEIIIINDFGKGVNFSSRTTEKDFELGAILSDNDNRMEGEFMIKYGYNKQSFYHCKFTAYRE